MGIEIKLCIIWKSYTNFIIESIGISVLPEREPRSSFSTGGMSVAAGLRSPPDENLSRQMEFPVCENARLYGHQQPHEPPLSNTILTLQWPPGP